MPRLIRWAPLAASAGMFLASLFVDAAHFRAETNAGVVTYSGAHFVLLGWMGPFVGVWAWFANPLLWTGWLCTALGAWRLAPVPLALSAWVASWHTSLWNATIPENEAGIGGLHLETLNIGFQLWWVAIATALVGSVAQVIHALSTRPAPPVETQ